MFEQLLHEFIPTASLPIILLVLLGSLLLLGKAADQAIDSAVKLAQATGLSNVVIGATIVSLGTTFPEAVVSVLAAVRGDASLALGNAVGSIICDTGLIMGLVCLLGRVPIDKFTVRRKGMVQLLAVLLLVLLAVPWQSPQQFSSWQGVVTQRGRFSAANTAHRLPRLVAVYTWQRKKQPNDLACQPHDHHAETGRHALAGRHCLGNYRPKPALNLHIALPYPKQLSPRPSLPLAHPFPN